MDKLIVERPKSKQNMPDDAKMVFKGQIFDVYQWEQEMYDGTTETFEKLKRLDTVVVLAVDKDGKIILTKQEQPGKEPFIGLPGGRLDKPGEEPVEGAERELLEETGMKAKVWEFYTAYQPISKVDWAIYYFIAKGCEKVEDLKLDAGEKIEVMKVDFDKFIEVVLDDNFADWEIKVDIMKMVIDGKLDGFRERLLA